MKKKRFGKEDWLRLGLSQLARNGNRGLGIEALCEVSGKTRGSFYHHFSDHAAFVGALMESWKKSNTIDVAEETLRQPASDQALCLSALATGLDQDLERAIRQFAQNNETAAKTVREVDQLRTDFVANLYLQQGLSPDLAMEIAQIEYAAFVGSQIVWPELSNDMSLALARRFMWLVEKAVPMENRNGHK
ncbi:TetR family transcriptional regulator [Roseibium sp. TrichSKD4]|uniref:TetR/AcrR family transcriptional regulator n=1 Tax=Roseibium sp. TrichSKD4 TaxID=744980 RepID=UPI0001E56CBF|nr:TetR/AcrR family transcriptional regulator [Roseibium sp. TrichSKD4]EFO32709.1 TetR family transcriptional regulator [Roseibium sp. TrichSKD4]